MEAIKKAKFGRSYLVGFQFHRSTHTCQIWPRKHLCASWCPGRCWTWEASSKRSWGVNLLFHSKGTKTEKLLDGGHSLMIQVYMKSFIKLSQNFLQNKEFTLSSCWTKWVCLKTIKKTWYEWIEYFQTSSILYRKKIMYSTAARTLFSSHEQVFFFFLNHRWWDLLNEDQ